MNMADWRRQEIRAREREMEEVGLRVQNRGKERWRNEERIRELGKLRIKDSVEKELYERSNETAKSFMREVGRKNEGTKELTITKDIVPRQNNYFSMILGKRRSNKEEQFMPMLCPLSTRPSKKFLINLNHPDSPSKYSKKSKNFKMYCAQNLYCEELMIGNLNFNTFHVMKSNTVNKFNKSIPSSNEQNKVFGFRKLRAISKCHPSLDNTCIGRSLKSEYEYPSPR